MFGDHPEQMRGGDDRQEGNDQDGNAALESLLQLGQVSRDGLQMDAGALTEPVLPGFRSTEI